MLMRADFTGLTMVPFVELVTETQLRRCGEEQMPISVRLSTAPLVVTSFSSWRVGRICRAPSLMNEFSSELVVYSNWPLLRDDPFSL